MDRKLALAGFSFGFAAVIVLMLVWSFPTASPAEARPTIAEDSVLIVPGSGGGPVRVTGSTIVTAPPKAFDFDQTDPTFGDVMPDGQRCGINCDYASGE